MRMTALLLLLPLTASAAVPQPVRDSAYDWRCVNPDGTATNHQRQDTAIYACQTRAEADPGQTYYIEGGRYRVRVEPPPTEPAPFTPDLTYVSGDPSGDSIHPQAPAGSTVEVEFVAGASVLVLPSGSTRAASSSWTVRSRYRPPGGEYTAPEETTWSL